MIPTMAINTTSKATMKIWLPQIMNAANVVTINGISQHNDGAFRMTRAQGVCPTTGIPTTLRLMHGGTPGTLNILAGTRWQLNGIG